ncbi:uncharacterized protein LOC143352254 [Halictus rubicundus]|uniref:uncharacterized protein LOC143352254 n=1 Tax=Halictus rubicundus TaxID=77578 RepID=UPI00403701D8
MAPRILTDYHSAEETNACSLRILKRGGKNVSQQNHASASNINGKEDFFRCLGLQMKRFQCPYPTLHGVHHNIKEQSQSDGVKLRNCSVVVLGVTCSICGKCFKCETDLNAHVALKHSAPIETVITAREHKQDSDEVCQRVCAYYKCKTVSDKSSTTKLQSKLRLVFRIGDEIVVNTTVKRKHLKYNKTSIATQTEPAKATELIMENNTCEGDVPGIDHTVFDNSPCQCCTATICVANGTNQYIAGNYIEKNPTECEEITRLNKTCSDDRLVSTCETSIFPSNSIPFKSDGVITNTDESNLVSRIDGRIIKCPLKNKNFTDTETAASIKLLSVTEKKSENSRHKESLKSTSTQVVDSVTVTFQSHSKDSSGSEKSRDLYTEKVLQRSSGVNTVQLVMPVILPIIMPHHTSSRTVANQHPSSFVQEQDPRTCFVDEQTSDDEVQEVLRIVRGHDNVANDINHESPNRLEQEMLARDVIKDMLRMEQQGWHLLERQDVETAKKRRRSSTKFDTRNGVADEIPKKKANSVSSENNIVKTMTNERNVSKESFAKMQKSSHDKLSISENAKENVLTCNGNISIPSETLLQQYSANYYTDVCEINNNTEAIVQEPVSSCIFIPLSTGIENIGNKPTVIDLVNDTEE